MKRRKRRRWKKRSNSQSAASHKTPSWFVPLSNPLCEACGKNKDIEECLNCTKCSNFFHITCTGLPDYELVKYFKKNLYK